MPWTLRGKPKNTLTIPKLIICTVLPSSEVSSVARWITATHRGCGWASMVSLSPGGSNKTRSRYRWRYWRMKKKKEEAERSNHWDFFPAGIQKDVVKSTRKKKGIAYFYFLFCSFLYEMSKFQTYYFQYDSPSAIGSLCMSVSGWAQTYYCTTYYTDKEFSQTPGWQSRPSFTHSCSHWERTVIKLLIALHFSASLWHV